MFEVNVKSILSAGNGMNPFRGCSHGCIYCDARSTCYQIHPDRRFEDIEIKKNAPQLLELALRRKKERCMIGTGGMSDPYIPLEKELGLTRRCLELIDEYGFGLAIQTKSDLILRDLDLLKSIHRKTKCVVQITLTTHDEVLCRKLEPHVCTTKRRAEVLDILREEGIPTVCWMTPILPFINDTEENIHGILDYCIHAKTYGILTFGIGVTLRDGDRQYFYQQLDAHFPGLKKKYMDTYGKAYEVGSPRRKELMKLFKDACRNSGLNTDISQLFSYIHEFEDKREGEQLSLMDFMGG